MWVVGGAGDRVAKFELNVGLRVFLMCKQSIHGADWRPFGDGNL